MQVCLAVLHRLYTSCSSSLRVRSGYIPPSPPCDWSLWIDTTLLNRPVDSPTDTGECAGDGESRSPPKVDRRARGER
eukprot:1188479-Prorocentrum_minimum.AAC.2